ncbi:hypothetical protein CCR75_008404 [Bremia lactucae]|uniref:Uncharacterized protein n=1 Tax=Bremia lactucae TaxID=4779 RepID=A0A976IE73_BRELC|nr:hypothetical protein CCR75_008404 [Bremia lactucae]
MEHPSSSTPSSAQDMEAQHRSREENEGRKKSSKPQRLSDSLVGLQKTEEDDFTDVSQKSRKKQKTDSGDYVSQIASLQQEIKKVKEALAAPQQQSRSLSYELGKQCFQAKQTAAILRRKLAEHAHWLQQVSSLMETAPLLNFAVSTSMEKQELKGLQHSMSGIAEWRGKAKYRPHPRLIIDERLRAAVTSCQANASKLLQDASTDSTLLQQSFEFESYGWKIATGTLVSDQIGFICHRTLPHGANKAREIAMAIWNTIERDEIFRTFVPLVQDSFTTFQGSDYSLSCRVLLLSQEMNQQAVATVETISSTHDDEGPWQISMEAVHDHYLCTFVAEISGDSVIPNTCPPVKLDLGLQMSKLNMHNNFVVGARVVKTEEGVDLVIAGSACFDLPCYREPTFDLLQHFASHMPVYEDLHLTTLVDCHDKTATEVF